MKSTRINARLTDMSKLRIVFLAYGPPSHDYRIKAVLRLPGKGLATGDLDEDMYPAFRRCVSKLVHKVTAYKDRLEDAEAIAGPRVSARSSPWRGLCAGRLSVDDQLGD